MKFLASLKKQLQRFKTSTHDSPAQDGRPQRAREIAGIYVGEVLEVAKHPNADRLRVVTVGLGDRIVSPIVCGAWNFDVGDKVVLALPGALITRNIHSPTHEPFVLGKAVIRGIESQGMLCAAFELGLSSDKGEGILIVPKGTPPGTSFNQLIASTWRT